MNTGQVIFHKIYRGGKMRSLNDLDIMKDKCPNKSKIIDVSNLKIDTSLPVRKRLERLISKIKNPYHFKCGKVTVSTKFNDRDTIENYIKEYFINSKF
jgi:hypothetical protein